MKRKDIGEIIIVLGIFFLGMEKGFMFCESEYFYLPLIFSFILLIIGLFLYYKNPQSNNAENTVKEI